MNRPLLAGLLGCALLALSAGAVAAFCGFYVAKADTRLFNKASKVVIVRDGEATVITMANDYRGELAEFALVVPVPQILERDQIEVGEAATIDHLDAYTAPRLVEYFDEPPMILPEPAPPGVLYAVESLAPERTAALGVTIEAEYTVGEYDIVILSATESSGLATWLTESGYRIPEGADRALATYLAQGMRFFVAKVNLTEQTKLGFTYLRPLRIAFSSPDFMLPIRLGMVNADGPQELFVFTLTRKGRVETANYRTVSIPSDEEIPLYVKDEFAAFYKAMFDTQVAREDMRVVFLEYAWDMGWCDPCAADPLTLRELESLGVTWLEGATEGTGSGGLLPPGDTEVFVTRLHLRYDDAHFPDDLMFRETDDDSNFQGRYVLRHPWYGEVEADFADWARDYYRELPLRFEREAQTLASLTGWDINEIRARMAATGQVVPPELRLDE